MSFVQSVIGVVILLLVAIAVYDILNDDKLNPR